MNKEKEIKERIEILINKWKDIKKTNNEYNEKLIEDMKKNFEEGAWGVAFEYYNKMNENLLEYIKARDNIQALIDNEKEKLKAVKELKVFSNRELKTILKCVKENFSDKKQEAERVEMAIRQDYEDEILLIINKLQRMIDKK